MKVIGQRPPGNTPPYVDGVEGPGEDLRDTPDEGSEARPITERADVTPQPVTPVERMGNQDIREIAVGATAVASRDDYLLSFPCAIAIADNNTNQWWRIGSAQTWVPPFAVNFPVFMMGNKRALVTVDTPPGIFAEPIVAGQVLTMRYMEKPQDAKPILTIGPITPIANVAEATSLVVKATAGRFFGMSGYITGINVQSWIQIHNAAALPANGAVPMYSLPKLASLNVQDVSLFVEGEGGDRFSNGIVIALSTTGPTLTLYAVGAAMFVMGRMR